MTEPTCWQDIVDGHRAERMTPEQIIAEFTGLASAATPCCDITDRGGIQHWMVGAMSVRILSLTNELARTKERLERAEHQISMHEVLD